MGLGFWLCSRASRLKLVRIPTEVRRTPFPITLSKRLPLLHCLYVKIDLQITPLSVIFDTSMKSPIALLLLLFSVAQAHAEIPNVSQSVACVEEAIQSFPEDGLSAGDDLGWHKDINEMMKRTGGKLNEADPKFAADWLLQMGATGAKSKLQTIYEVADANDMPPQILAGALSEESSMADFGLSRDYGNWSCGIGQLNLLEWCVWANSATTKTKNEIAWPTAEIEYYLKENQNRDICSAAFIRSALAKPFYVLAMKRMQAGDLSRPEFLLTSKYISEPTTLSFEEAAPMLDWVRDKKIPCKRRNRQNDECLEIQPSLDEAKATHLRYSMAKSFTEHCGEHQYGIPARGRILRSIFDSLPEEYRLNKQNTDSGTYSRKCLHEPKFKGTPLAVGWLVTEAVYNAGEEILDGLAHYWHTEHRRIDDVTPDGFLLAMENTIEKEKYKKRLDPVGRCEGEFHTRNLIKDMSLPGATLIDHLFPPTAECRDIIEKYHASAQAIL